MGDWKISIISVIIGAFLGTIISWIFGKKTIIFQEYRQIIIEFRNILVSIYNSIDRLENDNHFDASKFIVSNFDKTDLIFNNLILNTRNIRCKNKIIEAYNNYKKPYEISPEVATPFIKFDPDWKTKEYQKKYGYKDIPDGINIAKKNIEYLIHVISYHNIFSKFCCSKKNKI